MLVEVNTGCGWKLVEGFIAYPYCPSNYSYKIYPNPSKSGFINLEINEAVKNNNFKVLSKRPKNKLNILYEIKNFTGSNVISKQILSTNRLINVSKIKKSIYFLTIYNGDKVEQKKIVVD